MHNFVGGVDYLCSMGTSPSADRFAIPDDHLRFMALQASLLAADALTEPAMRSDSRANALTRAYGLVMALRGPAHSLGFAEFRTLVRGPVAGLLPPGCPPEGLEAIYAINPKTGERNVELEALEGEFGEVARECGVLPYWPWLRQELTEHKAYALFRKGGNQAAYILRRSFVIRNAAGTQAMLQMMPKELNDLYGRVPEDRVYDRRCFLCPLCRWPMQVLPNGPIVTVSCANRDHRDRGARYLFDDDGLDRAPRLVRTRDVRDRLLAPAASDAIVHEAARVLMVDPACWRSHVIPGLLETALHDELSSRGVQVELWPEMDRYDLRVIVAGRQPRVWKIDVKDVLSVDALINRLDRKNADGTGLHLVVPDRLSSDVPLLRRRLSSTGWKVRTASQLAREVCRAQGVPWR
ncbi:hypothetical protein GCM10009556_076510 [Acrocarpospora pleiomorpha]